MPLIDGEKYACSSCIKGHRVSGCNHTDRELHHINPKGRPVKQCEHCRGARKSKSHHAKCDCGEKKDKPKDKGDAKVHDNSCACHSGSVCICGVKTEALDLTLDTGRQTLHDARSRPTVMTTHSEDRMTVFSNGHHKPCHRNNNSAHVSGAPYKLPRPHTLHGHSAFAAFAQGNTYPQVDSPAPRSMDTLSLSNNDFYLMFGSTPQSDVLPLTPLAGSLDTNGFQDSLFTSCSSTFTHSPTESHVSDTAAGSQWPWTSSVASAPRNIGYGSLSTSPSQDCLPNLDNEWGIPSAGLANPATWSAVDLPLDPSKLSDTLVQPISHSGESKQSAPGLSSSSSPSDMGEPVLFSDLDVRTAASTVGDNLFWEDTPVYRPAPTTVHDGRPPTSVPQSFTPESQNVELDFTKTMSPVPATMASSGVNMYSDAPAITMPNNIDDFASNDPWSLGQSNTAFTGFPSYENPTYPDWL